MPNTKSAEKALRQSDRRHIRNVKQKKSMKDVLKRFEKALLEKNNSEALSLLSSVQGVIDKAAKRNLITKNTAARKKSRIAKRLKKLV
ncbi:MAG: 30S ribosomal protein S20 [Patescibacteria group bacterium]